MNNPLVFFVGAAVVAVTVLAGATYDRWRDWPTALQNTAEGPGAVAEDSVAAGGLDSGKAEPDVETAGDVPADEPLPEAVAEAPAAEPAADAEPAQPEEPEEPLPDEVAEVPSAASEEGAAGPERLAAVEPEEPQPAVPAVPSDPVAPAIGPEAAIGPSFDVVRLEEDGSLIAVGRAAPEAVLALLLDGKAIAASQANEIGEWLIMPDDPLPPGDHELTVEARDAVGAGTTSSEAVSLSVPQRAVIAHSEPLPPPSPEAVAAPEPEDAAASEPAEAPGLAEEEEQVALAPPPEAEAEPEPEPEPSIDTQSPPEALEVPLSLETVDYNDGGDIVFSGRADPGRSVRIYVDNRFVGETTADLDGRWIFAGREQIAPGRHSLRTDLIDMTGKVSGRIELPFMRADSREIAALVEARREAAEEEAAAPQFEVASEQDAPAVAKQAVPGPEPEAPAVAEQTAPEPEPEAPAMVEQIAPEPEPEAPAVVEQIAPEPEPEAPAVVEQATPEPEPEAPAVAEQVAPEPEPEAPTVAEQVAPDPEPEAPAVAEQAVPEPEPEAPALAAQPAPEAKAPAVAEAVVPEPAPEASELAETVLPEPEPEAAEAPAAEPVQASDASVVAALEEQPAPEPVVAPSGPGHVVIQPGNNLWRISRVIYGRGVEYTVIYQANREQIRDPDLIYPGQIFATPGVHPPAAIDPDWRQPLDPEDVAGREAGQ